MTPSSDERDAIFKTFGRAFFKQNLDLLFTAVTPDFTCIVHDDDTARVLDSREKIAAFFNELRGRFANVRFDDVVFHHAPGATFMTYRKTAADTASGKTSACVGIKRYTFHNGMLTEKGVYSRPI